MTVYDIIQDDLGYMWLATSNGLCRYDGVNVKTFSDTRLKDSGIIDIEKDHWDRIWMINITGQIAYAEKDTLTLVPIQPISQEKAFLKLYVHQKNVWVHFREKKSRRTGLLSYKLGVDGKPFFHQQITFSHSGLSLIFEGQGDRVVVGRNQDGLTMLHYNIDLDIVKEEPFSPIVSDQSAIPPRFNFSLTTEQILLPYLTPDNQLYIATIQDSTLGNQFILENPALINRTQIIDQQFWILSNKEVWICDFPLLGQKQVKPRKILESINANNVILDREGSYWVVTEGQGVLVIPNLALQSEAIFNGQQNIPETYTIQYDSFRKRIIAGHPRGIISIHQTDHSPRIRQLPTEAKIRKIVPGTVDTNLYIITNVGIIVIDENGKVKKELGVGGIKTFLQTQSGDFWHGNSYSASRLKLTDGTKSMPPVLSRRTYALYQSKDQRIWQGTVDGLYVLKDTFEYFADTALQIPPFITDFTETQAGVLWVSTQNQGIFAIENDRVTQHYQMSEGLSSNQCRQLFWDGSWLWIATSEGVNYLDPSTQLIGHWNKKDGLPSDEINDVIVVEEEVWVATPRGLVHFPRQLSHQNNQPPLIHLTAVKVWGESYPFQRPLSLAASENYLTFEFVGLALRAKNSVSYKYKMSGVDTDWIYTQATTARYPVLNPGHYRFEVLAINEDGVESDQVAKVSFVIAPHWWQRWWVISTAVLIFWVSIFYYFYRQQRKAEQKRLIENRILKLKQKALQIQMNPHFIFNALSAIQKSLTTNDLENALLYLSRFAKLIRLIFEYSKVEQITLEEEIDFLKLYLNLEQLRFKNKIQVEFTIDPKLDQELFTTSIPSLLLQPLVENAFKHGLFHKKEPGRLRLHFSRRDDFLYFTIEDNGVGRSWTQSQQAQSPGFQEHQSSGIENIKARLQLINELSNQVTVPDLIIEDLMDGDIAMGTRVQVFIFRPH